MFNANKELNEIIVKYDIDRQNGRFRQYVQAVSLLNQFVLEYGDVLFVVSNNESVNWLKHDLWDFRGEFAVVDVLDEKTFAGIGDRRAVVIASHYFQGEMSTLLKRNGVSHTCLYDYFLRHGLAFDHEYCDIFGAAYIDLSYHRKSYDFYDYSPYLGIIHDRDRRSSLANDDVLAKLFRERELLAFLYIRDFVTAKQRIEEYLSLYSEDVVDYQGAWAEIEVLLGQLKEKLRERGQKGRQRDIIMFVLDALEHGTDAPMPFLAGLSRHSLVFESACTVTPYTFPTMQSLFAGKKIVTDRSYETNMITKENSPLIEKLCALGFDFRLYGRIGALFAEPLRGQHSSLLACSPAPLVFWNALADLANSGQPSFFVLHQDFETHSPFWCPLLDNFCFNGKADTNATAENINISKGYIDRQLEFYSAFLPEAATKIYMSDHGQTLMGRWHTLLKVQDRAIPPKTETRLFSYLDFDKLIDYILAPAEAKYEGLLREKAEVQDLDFYHGLTISRFINNKKLPPQLVGYQGTVTAEDVYIRHNHGLELFLKHQNDGILFSPERLEYLRAITSRDRIDIEKDKKFIYTRYTYKVLEKYHQRNHEYEERKTAALKDLFTGGGGY
jgi:hypothetical protein